jgi:hypothetical protein
MTARAVWRDQPGTLLVSYLALAWLPAILRIESFPTPKSALLWFAVLTFLTWRIWRGGHISRILLTVLAVLQLAFILGAPAALSIYLLTVFTAMQLAILLSPAVRQRSQRARIGRVG